MFCPQCGHQQTSGQSRFCPTCGFSLGVVTALFANNGNLPERVPKRHKGKRLAVLLLLTGFLTATIGGLLNEAGAANTLLLFGPGILCLMAGFVRLLYAWLLEDNGANGNVSASLPSPRNTSSFFPARGDGIYETATPAGFNARDTAKTKQ